MTRDEALAGLLGALHAAEEKHPVFPVSRESGLALIMEELGELAMAINDNEPEDELITEALHVAVVAIRFVENRNG